MFSTHLLNSFISSNSVLVKSLGFLCYNIISYANSDSFVFHSNFDALPTMFMAEFFWLRLPVLCWIRARRTKAFNFSPLSMMLAIYGLYYVEVCAFYTYLVDRSYCKWKLDFTQCFFWMYWDDCITLGKSRCMIPPTFFFFFKISLAIWGIL